MMIFWGLLLGLPCLAFGGVALVSPASATRFVDWFRTSRVVACVLTAVAWVWTTYEIMTFGVNPFAEFAANSSFVFKMILSSLAFCFDHFWLLTPFLVVLTVLWMPKNLPVRALTGLLMLIPAELFKTTHLYRPVVGSGLAAVDFVVAIAYLGAILGMYGMFYPWRLEKGMAIVLFRDWAARTFGSVCVAVGLALVLIGFAL